MWFELTIQIIQHPKIVHVLDHVDAVIDTTCLLGWSKNEIEKHVGVSVCRIFVGKWQEKFKKRTNNWEDYIK